MLFAIGQSRVIRGSTLVAKQQQYVDAAMALGAGHLRIIVRHILPNIFAIILVQASITVGAAILVESALSFLGYGVQPPEASWGRMINDARQWMIRAPHLATFPGMAIFVTVWSFTCWATRCGTSSTRDCEAVDHWLCVSRSFRGLHRPAASKPAPRRRRSAACRERRGRRGRR